MKEYIFEVIYTKDGKDGIMNFAGEYPADMPNDEKERTAIEHFYNCDCRYLVDTIIKFMLIGPTGY